MSQTRYQNDRNLRSNTLEARSLKARYQGPCSRLRRAGTCSSPVCSCFSARVFWACGAYPHSAFLIRQYSPSPIHTAFPLCASLSMSAFSLFGKVTSAHLGLGTTLMTSFYLDYLWETLFPNKVPFWGMGGQTSTQLF